MVFFAALLLFSLLIINKIYARLRKYPQSVESGLILGTAFMNSGNYGAPIILFAYGELGFAYSISFLVLQAIIMNFFGVYYAARGAYGIGKALETVLKMPATYAVLIALALQGLDIEMPSNIFSAIDLVAEATIPIVMIVLGMQLAEIKLRQFQWGKIWYGVAVRMVASPLIAFGLIQFIPMEPLLQKVLIVSAAMPSAATTTMYAVQFDAEPDLVSSITLITTLVSIFTITILLIYLG
jgi:predicted permease